MHTDFEVAIHYPEPGKELVVDCLRPFENALTDCVVRITRLGFCVLFGHWSVPQLLWWIDLLIREATVLPSLFGARASGFQAKLRVCGSLRASPATRSGCSGRSSRVTD